MYIHIGGNKAVRVTDIIGVFDLDNTTTSRRTREFLDAAQKRGQVEDACDDIPRSFVVCGGRKKSQVYLSQVASRTIEQRTGRGLEL